MASGVLLQSLGNGSIWDQFGNALNNHSVFVYLRGTTTQVQVYSDATLTTPLTQPLLTGASGAGPGGIPGYVAGGVSLDFVDASSGSARTQTEPLSASSVQTLGAGGVVQTFNPAKYGIPEDGVTDSATNWLTLISALPAGKAIIQLNGLSYISNPGALAYALGFNTSDLTIIGQGPQTGFILAPGSNCNVLRFNTSSTFPGPPRLQRVHLERFAIYQNGYQQIQSTDTKVGAIYAGEIDHFTMDHVEIHQARAVAIFANGCRNTDIDSCLIDGIIPDGAANGIDIIGGTGSTNNVTRVHNCHFVDVPDRAVNADAANTTVSQIGNTAEYRNLLPAPISGTTPAFPSSAQTSPAWSSGTNYAVGATVSSGGFNWLALVASGPGNGGAVTPGTNNSIWMWQNVPTVWSSGTTYVIGQAVTFTVPTGITLSISTTTGTRSVPGGSPLQFTALAGNTNQQPVSNAGALNANWQIGGPVFATQLNSAFTAEVETTVFPTQGITVDANTVNGRNAAGQYVLGTGVFVQNDSGAAGAGAVSMSVLGNTIVGTSGIAISVNDEAVTVTGNTLDDVTAGIRFGTALVYLQRSAILADNVIRLGGIGGGQALAVSKAYSSGSAAMRSVSVHDNMIDGGLGPDMILQTALTSGNAATSVVCSAAAFPMPAGTMLNLGTLVGSGGSPTINVVTLSAPRNPGDTTLAINSYTPGTTIGVGSNVSVLQGILSGSLTSGVPITALPVGALIAPIQQGTQLAVISSSSNSPLVVTTTANAAIGATSIPIQSITPGNASYTSGQPFLIAGFGLAVTGAVTDFVVHDNIIRWTLSNGLTCASNAGFAPSEGKLRDNRIISCVLGLNIDSACTFIEAEGGSVLNTTGAALTATGTGANLAKIRRIEAITPQAVTPPSVPATTVAIYNSVPYDVMVYITAGASTCAVAFSRLTSTVTFDTAGTVPSGGFGSFLWLAGQQVKLTYASAPTWTMQGL